MHPPDLLELVAHELRTPVTSLYGAAQLLDREPEDSGRRRELLAEMADGSARLVRFLEDLLALAEASAGAMRTEPVLLQRIVDGVVARVRADDASARVVVEQAADVGPALGDPEALRHALGNMLGHAVRATPAGEVVHVTVEARSGVVTVAIRERVPRPSADGEVLDRSDLLVEPGGRLWLAAAQALVRAMGGELRVTRHGTLRTMCIALPAAEE